MNRENNHKGSKMENKEGTITIVKIVKRIKIVKKDRKFLNFRKNLNVRGKSKGKKIKKGE